MEVKITDKHRIAYKNIGAPGELVEMAIYRDDEGDYMSVTGLFVAYPDGEPKNWVKDMLDGTSELYVGEIIPPPLEPELGTVVRNPNDHRDYFVCFRTGDSDYFEWIDRERDLESTDTVRNLINQAGWEVVS